MKMKNEEQIAAKEAEIKNYERILSEYRGRWYDMGKRNLEKLQQELADLSVE